MPQDLGPKRMTLQQGNLQLQTRGDLTAILWRDKHDVHILTNMHNAPADGNFCDNNGTAIKPQIVADYNRHMGYVDNGDRMANSYSINRRTWKWTKKLFFHLFDLAILNSYVLFSSCGVKKISHRDFELTLVRNLLAQAGQERNVARPMEDHLLQLLKSLDLKNVAENIGLFHLPREENVVCSARDVNKRVSTKCRRRDVSLCRQKMLSRLPQQDKSL